MTLIRSIYSLIVIISIEALLLATYLAGSRTVMQMQSNAIGYAKFYIDSRRLNIRTISNSGTPLGLSANMRLPDCFSPTLLLPQLVLAVLVQEP